MPELPEVEAARRLLEKECQGKRITRVHASERGGGPREGEFDAIVFDDAEATDASVSAALTGKTLVAVRRKGKQLWLELSSPPHLLAHFGMTGTFVVEGAKSLALQHQDISARNHAWPPRFTKCELEFGETKLAFSDPRRLGRLRLRSAPEEQEPWRSLAPDPINETVSVELIRDGLAGKGGSVKARLLDQAAVISGVGNWVADEVLYQAGIHPEAVCCELSDAQVAALHAALSDVLQTACRVNADASRFPKEWLFHYRWGKGKGAAHVPGGGLITFLTVGGRTSAVVVAKQRKGESASGAPKRKKAAAGDAAGGAKRPRAKAPTAAASPRTTKGDKTPRRTGTRAARAAA